MGMEMTVKTSSAGVGAVVGSAEVKRIQNPVALSVGANSAEELGANPTQATSSAERNEEKTSRETPEQKGKRCFDVMRWKMKAAIFFMVDGQPQMLWQGKRYQINADRDNIGIKQILSEHCGSGLNFVWARHAVDLFQVHAVDQAKNLTARHFSAISHDDKRLYMLLEKGELLQISAESIRSVPNGRNQDTLFIEPDDSQAFAFTKLNANEIAGALTRFEELLVNTQATVNPKLSWLVAFQLGVLPIVRDLVPIRFHLSLNGSSGAGKTTGAEKFARLLHNRGVHGDYSAAAIGDSKDDGLMVLDNKENRNLTPALQDYLFFAATGGGRGRSNVHGIVRTNQQVHPIIALTSIEGVDFKPELKRRFLRVEYGAGIERKKEFDHFRIVQEIKTNRNVILSATAYLLQATLRKWLALDVSVPDFAIDFPQNYKLLVALLFAYAELATKPEGWAQEVLESWRVALGASDESPSELEDFILPILSEWRTTQKPVPDSREWKGRNGSLVVTTTTQLLGALKRAGAPDLPRGTSSLGRRLRDTRFHDFAYVETDTPGIPEVARTAGRRPIAFFIYD